MMERVYPSSRSSFTDDFAILLVFRSSACSGYVHTHIVLDNG